MGNAPCGPPLLASSYEADGQEHQLAYFVRECCKAIMKGDSDEANCRLMDCLPVTL